MAYYRVSVDLKDGRRDMYEAVLEPKIDAGGLLLPHENMTVWISCANIENWVATKMLPTAEMVVKEPF